MIKEGMITLNESGAITTWTWNTLGDLTAIGYTGDSNLTPDVTITAHTRLGQPSTLNHQPKRHRQ